jgi:hypothetical protein
MAKLMRIEYVVDVCNWETTFPPSNLLEFQDWLQKQLNKVPDEYKSKTVIDIYGSNEEGNEDVEIVIKYYRPETDEEELARLKAIDRAIMQPS